MRFLKLEKIVSDFMSTCSGPEGPGHYRYGMWMEYVVIRIKIHM